jgi:hypothetical protein
MKKLSKDEEKAIRAQVKQAHPEAVFYQLPRFGLIALGAVDYEAFLAFLSGTGSPSSDKTLLQEQLVIDGLVYPTEPDSKVKVRHILRCMPFLLGRVKLHDYVEDCSRRGEVGELKLTPEERVELERKHEFGIAGISTDLGNIIVTTNETSAPFVRVVLNETQGARKDIGKKIVAAILASLADPGKRDEVEKIVQDRPGIIPPLWLSVMQLTGDADAEVEKN